MNFLFSHTPLDFTWNQSIGGVLKRLFGDTIWGYPPLSWPAVAAPLSKVLEAIVIGITSLLAFRYYNRRRPSDGLADDTAAFLLMMYLVAPVSWDHHLVYVLPAAILALGFILEGRIRGKAAFGLAVILCMLAWRVELDVSFFKKHWWTLLGFVKFYAVAALWVFFVVRLARASFRTTEEYGLRAPANVLQSQV
jgi:Ca2+/Na+ antiporter